MNAVTEPRPRPSVGIIYRVSQTLYLLVGIVEALIIIRVALKLLAANPAVGFVRFVYGISAPLVAPFQGIFPTPVSSANVLELSSLVAIAVYGLIAWGVVSLIFIAGRRPLPTTAG
ncbi:MAG TPA: YggT family protein [Ktedonobacterales bacterium]|nr:YggT family protein [Ktedonobacterales bacterium]